MKLLQTPLKVPYLKKYCPLNKKEPAEDLYFHVFFLRKITFHFPPKKYYHIFGEKKYHLSWWYKKDHIPVRFFWKDHLFRTFRKRKYGFRAVFGRWFTSNEALGLCNMIIVFRSVFHEGYICYPQVFLERIFV